jgi:hypothetical protein
MHYPVCMRRSMFSQPNVILKENIPTPSGGGIHAAGPGFATCCYKKRRHLRTCSCLFTAVSNSVAAAESERHFSGIVIGKRIRFSCCVTQGCAPAAETNDVSLRGKQSVLLHRF